MSEDLGGFWEVGRVLGGFWEGFGREFGAPQALTRGNLERRRRSSEEV